VRLKKILEGFCVILRIFLLDKNDEICIIISVRMRILSLGGDRALCTEDELVIYE